MSTTADKVWAVGRPTIGTAVELAARLKVYGKERVPLNGGLVIASNHFHWVDPPALGASCPRTIYFMAKVEAHRVPGLGPSSAAFGTFPVRRGESDRDAVRTMRAIVRDGLALGLFAEGTRQRSGVPGELQPGAAMVALQEDVPVDSGRDPRLADVEARQLPPDLARLGRADPIRRAAEGWQGLQGGVGHPAGEDSRALRLPRRDARARPAGRRAAAMSEDDGTLEEESRRRASSPAPLRSSASRTSASRR